MKGYSGKHPVAAGSQKLAAPLRGDGASGDWRRRAPPDSPRVKALMVKFVAITKEFGHMSPEAETFIDDNQNELTFVKAARGLQRLLELGDLPDDSMPFRL